MTTGKKIGLLTALYLSQGLPFGFFTQALPVLLREQGASLPAIGLTYLLVLPWALKFLWAPLVDAARLPGTGRILGQRRAWLLPLQAAGVGVLIAAGLVDPATSMPLVLASVLAINLVAATQDIATDGLAVEVLDEKERGLGNGVQVAGYRVGMILGGGALLVVFERIGWTLSFFAMAALLALCTIPVWFFREGAGAAPSSNSSTSSTPLGEQLRALTSSFTRPGMGAWLLLLVLFKAGDAFGAGMLRPFLVDIGRSIGDVGWMLGGVGFVTGLLGALAGGVLAARAGRVRALLVGGFAQVLAVTAYALAAFELPALAFARSDVGLSVLVGADHFAGGVATVALFTMMMDRSRPAHAGTDYTVQASVVVLATGVAAALAGPSAQALGHGGHFLLGGALSLLGFVVVARAAMHPSGVVQRTARSEGDEG